MSGGEGAKWVEVGERETAKKNKKSEAATEVITLLTHLLYFFLDPHGHNALREILDPAPPPGGCDAGLGDPTTFST